ncbi:hypothetical protein D3C71_1262200 [compost metagenome]
MAAQFAAQIKMPFGGLHHDGKLLRRGPARYLLVGDRLGGRRTARGVDGFAEAIKHGGFGAQGSAVVAGMGIIGGIGCHRKPVRWLHRPISPFTP